MKKKFILDTKIPKNPKVSYGIILFKKFQNNELPQVLTVTRADSYQFSSLIIGNYQQSQINKQFLECMTKKEQQRILSGIDFETLLYNCREERFVMMNPILVEKIIRTEKKRFNETIRILRTFVKPGILHGNLPISFPKGRNGFQQDPLTVVKDELFQETRIMYDNVKLVNGQIEIIYEDGGTGYHFIMFVGVMKNFTEPYIDLGCHSQLSEISAIQWHSIDSIRNIETDPVSQRVYVDNFSKYVNAGLEMIQARSIFSNTPIAIPLEVW